MKKYLLSLVVMMLSCITAFAGDYKVDETKALTADAISLDGVTAVVTDVAGEKTWVYFTGGDSQDVNTNCTSVAGWSSFSQYSYIKFFAVEGQADDVYYIKFVNADGDIYVPKGSWHDGSGCMNVTGNGNGLFVGGLTDKNGQDAANGALWKVAKTAEGYTLYNIGKERYAAPGIGVTATETAVKLYSDFAPDGEFTNADFAQGAVGDVNIATYIKDGLPAQMQPVPGWKLGLANDDARAAGVVAYGSATTLGGAAYTVPAAGPEGTNGNALAMVGVWNGTVQYVQNATLPAGKYTMTVPVLNTAGTTAFVKNLIGVKYGTTEVFATTTLYPVGEWTNETVEFELTEETTVTVSVGYQGANTGSGASQHLFLDRVSIKAADPYETTLAVASVEGKTYLTDEIKIGEKTYNTYKIGTSSATGTIGVTIPAGSYGMSFYALSWSTATTTITATAGEKVESYTATGGGISGNSPYTYDAEKGGDIASHLYKFAYSEPLAEDVVVNLTAPARAIFFGINALTEVPETAWDGETVTTSMDNGVVTKLADLDNLVITLPGAKSIATLGEEDCQYMALQNEDGGELYGFWSPVMGGTYEIDGDKITISGFATQPGATTAIPAGTTKLYIEDYGTLTVDGKEAYLPTIELTANIAAPAEPFEYTVTNNGVEGDATKAVEASESGVMYQFEVKAEGKALSKGEGVPTLTLVEDATVDFGASQLVAYEAETAYIRFMTLQQPYFTQPGTYVLTIPEGTFVDAEGTPNAEATYKWVIIQGADPEPFDVVSVVNGSEAAPGKVDAISYMFAITTANAITGLGEGNITLTDADNQPVGGNAYVFGYEGEGGATTVYARFTFDTEDHQLHTPGTYTLNVPAGALVDSEGNPNNEFSATWTIKGDELEDNDITSKYIVNADLADGLNGWTAVTFNTPKKQANSGYATEAYAGWGALDVAEYSLTQKITLPAGTYKLTNNSFFRQAGGAKDNAEKSLAYLVAGEEQVLVKTLGSIDAKAYANTHDEGAGVLSSGKAMYFNEVDFTLAEEAEIEIGLKGTFDEAKSWMIASGFHLYDMSIDPAAKEDVSNLIANNSFENGTADWTVEGEWAEQNNGEAVKVGTRYVEKWQAAGNLPDASIMQTLTGLKNGKYILSAVAHSQGTGAFLVANDDRTEVTTKASLQSVETEVTDGTLTIGYVRDNYQGNWIAVDNFTLVYCAPATPQPEVINIETVEVGTFVDDSWQTNDVYYTATVKFKKPAGAKYAYSEGLHMELNGENTGVPFQFGMFGMIELEEGDSVTLVYKDAMLASTEDPEYEGDFRSAGSYVGTTEITFLNEDQWEIEGVVAKFTGSIVLPNLNAVEIGEPTFNIAAAQEEGVRITTGYIEANGIVMTLAEAKNITPDMQIKVVADLWHAVPGFGIEETDPGFNKPNFQPLIEGAEFTGDAMFGLPTVAMTDFAQAAIEAGEGNIFQILIKSIEVLDATGVVASYVDDPEAEPMGCAFAIEPWIETEATAVVSATAPNQYGDEFYQVTVTIENSDNEIAAAGVAKAFTEGVQFSMYDEEHDSLITFTFACDQLEGVEVAEEEDVVLTCTDIIPAITADLEFEGEFRAEGTYQASCDVVLVDANDKELGVAKFAGELILTKSITAINGVAAKFVVKDVIYTVGGVRVNAPVKGINIINGKKVIK